MSNIIKTLTKVRDELRASGNDALLAEIEEALNNPEIRIPVQSYGGGDLVVYISNTDMTYQAGVALDLKEVGFIDLTMAEYYPEKYKIGLKTYEKGDISLYNWTDPYSEDYTDQGLVIGDQIEDLVKSAEEEKSERN